MKQKCVTTVIQIKGKLIFKVCPASINLSLFLLKVSKVEDMFMNQNYDDLFNMLFYVFIV